jgi:hypothetical protein
LHFTGADPIGSIPIAELPEHPIAVPLPPDKKSSHPVDPSRAAEKYIPYLGVNVYHDGVNILY